MTTYAPFLALGWLLALNLTSMIAGPYFNRVLFYIFFLSLGPVGYVLGQAYGGLVLAIFYFIVAWQLRNVLRYMGRMIGRALGMDFPLELDDAEARARWQRHR
ncbi:hypothetical protein [Abyssibius alkaniclasticus]|uniref:hypothetical protein n=1 Tax=Abyssibius alkaniclasticus TaxID=2881234 RepID=UPI004058667A